METTLRTSAFTLGEKGAASGFEVRQDPPGTFIPVLALPGTRHDTEQMRSPAVGCTCPGSKMPRMRRLAWVISKLPSKPSGVGCGPSHANSSAVSLLTTEGPCCLALARFPSCSFPVCSRGIPGSPGTPGRESQWCWEGRLRFLPRPPGAEYSSSKAVTFPGWDQREGSFPWRGKPVACSQQPLLGWRDEERRGNK